MTFEADLFESVASSGFGSSLYLKTFKKRPHISKSKADAYSNCSYLSLGGFVSRGKYDALAPRYVGAESLTFDAVASVYEVNSGAAAVARFVEFGSVEAKFESFVNWSRNPNFEVRIIGMQNGQDTRKLDAFCSFLKRNHLKLFEADLFGAEKRHIAIDTSTGMSFNVLLEDRAYKPGELANSTTFEQYERSLR